MAGCGNWRTIMKPMATRMRARLMSTMRQQTPRVFGQNGLGADIVSTTTPAFVELCGPEVRPLLEL